jgi:hypothetical protein
MREFPHPEVIDDEQRDGRQVGQRTSWPMASMFMM